MSAAAAPLTASTSRRTYRPRIFDFDMARAWVEYRHWAESRETCAVSASAGGRNEALRGVLRPAYIGACRMEERLVWMIDMERCVARLPPRHQRALQAMATGEMSKKQAAQLQVSVRTLMRRHDEALEALTQIRSSYAAPRRTGNS